MSVSFPPPVEEPASGPLAKVAAAYVRFAARRSGLMLFLLFALAVASAVTAYRGLDLRTDFTELLPDNHPSVLALRSISGKQKSSSNLVMIVHSKDRDANNRFVDGIRDKLEALVPTSFTEIQWKPNTEVPEYAAKWKWLYADMSDLANAEELLDRVIARRTMPLLVDLDGDPEKELRELRQRLNDRVPQLAQNPTQDPAKAPRAQRYFEAEADGEHWLGVMMWRRRDGLATRGDIETMAAVRGIVNSANPTSVHPTMKVEYTGHIAQALDEQGGIKEDFQLATIACAALILLSIMLYFRRMAVLVVVGAPAILGVLLSLVLAAFKLQHLNINTAFLVSIILGNGINSPIVLMARYGEERRQGLPVEDALRRALRGAFLGTLSAMAAASIAYGSLLLTKFKGFNQFGLIGGAGMLIVWACTFVVVPPMVLFAERLRPNSMTPRPSWLHRPFAALGRLSERHAVLVGLAVASLLVLSVRPLQRYLQDPLEWNFNNLRTEETPSQNMWGRMEMLGMAQVGAGYVGNDAVFLVDRPEQADLVAEAVRKKDAALGSKHVLKLVRTLNSLLPEKQDEKLASLSRIRKKIDRYEDLMDEGERGEVTAWRPPDYLRRLTTYDLPKQTQDAFTEVEGPRGRFVGVDADSDNYYSWNGHDLLRIAKALTVEADGKTWVAASAATVFAGILETLIADGPQVTLAALAGVCVLILVLFGIRGAWPVLLSLAIGIVWMGGSVGAIDAAKRMQENFHVKINFMNFVALPITLGVGTEYAAQLWSRLRQPDSPPLADVLAETGSAVALCSLTTVIGYSTLLLSRNHALKSFGIIADLGEITTLFAALLGMPVLVVAVRRITRR
ncbi:MAG TPA: MMPL family transporter [Pseudomonadota bacterium]|nr:MMPL family transporter [Pseudomonadota bacterium]